MPPIAFVNEATKTAKTPPKETRQTTSGEGEATTTPIGGMLQRYRITAPLTSAPIAPAAAPSMSPRSRDNQPTTRPGTTEVAASPRTFAEANHNGIGPPPSGNARNRMPYKRKARRQ